MYLRELFGRQDESSSESWTTTITLTTEGTPQTTDMTITSTATPAASTHSADVAGNVPVVQITQTASPVAQTSETSSPNSRSSSPNAPIIAGVVCSIVAVSILSILVWFCWRRRHQKTVRISSSSSFGMESKEYSLNRQSINEEQHIRGGGELFNTNGGYHKPPPPPPTPRTPRRFSNQSMEICDSPHPEDDPIPEDPEKNRITPPPADQHPAYHPLPGESPEVPAYEGTYEGTPVPGTPISPETPVHSPQQKQHPAYHVHQLGQHPAFRTSPGRSPKKAAFKEHRTPKLDSEPIIPREELDNFAFFAKKERKHRSKRPQSLASPPGRSELPAEVPKTFVSQSQSDPNIISRFNASSKQPNSIIKNTLTRDNTGMSSRSIPIGLGVEGTNTSPKYFQLPIQGTGAKALKSSRKQMVEPSGSKPMPSHPATPLLPPPAPRMKSNMNEREDHVMSWASYSAGNLSGIGPSSSNGSSKSRKQRQREIELGSIGGGGRGDEDVDREIMRWSEIPTPRGREVYVDHVETPLSQVYRESWVERESWARR